MTEPVDLSNCDREPIHRPGNIQGFGALLAVDQMGIIRHASANLADFLGIAADRALGRPAGAFIAPGLCRTLRQRAEAATAAGTVERLFATRLQDGGQPFDLALHVSNGLLVIELEPPVATDAEEPSAMLRQLTAELDRAGGFVDFARAGAQHLGSLLGYDRAMVYRFDEDESGEVIAEVVRPGLGSFLGQRYPAGDIPRQARTLYLRNWIRMIADVDGVPMPVLGEGARQLDLSLAGLRAVSPIHLEYLRNMGVSASLSVSIIIQGRLWGLLACHHYSPRRVGCRRRAAAELFGQVFALVLQSRERRDEAERAATARGVQDRVLARIAGTDQSVDGIAALLPEIVATLGADGAGLSIQGQVRLWGEAPGADAFAALLAELRQSGSSEIVAIEAVAARHKSTPAWGRPAWDKDVAGILAVPLSAAPRDYLVFFRRELARTIVWAGAPAKTVGPLGDRLTPRKSFEAWQEVVRGRSAPWTQLDHRIAEGLRLALSEVVLRQAHRALEERREAGEKQKLLIAELNHRVRNILALIAALVAQTRGAMTSGSAGQAMLAIDRLEGRVQALARAHDQLTREEWAPTPLARLLAEELAPYAGEGAHRAPLQGPDVLITPRAFSTLALLFHELATNAAKHGAFSTALGQVSVSWRLTADRGLAIDWVESGGPPVRAPLHRGFGSTFVEKAVPFDLRGEARVDYLFAGLRAHFSIPAAHVATVRAPLPAAAAPAPGLARVPAHVLLVEDDLLIAMDLESELRSLGVATVAAASSVQQALAMIEATPPAFALLDINLSGETTFPVASVLRQRGIPFAFVTGYGDDKAVLGEFAGRPVLAKPFGRRALRDILRAGA
jgi:light-regulated signal transduction histidine kinase (bacteriophytochrome)